MEQTFVAFTANKVDMLRKRGWKFTPVLPDEIVKPEKGVLLILLRGKRFKAYKALA